MTDSDLSSALKPKAAATTKTSATLAPQSGPPVFTDDPLTAGVTIKAVHVTELRDAVNQARSLGGLGAASWAETVASGVTIKAAHIVELRTRLDEARAALGLSAASYTDPNLTAGITVKAAHLQELRDRVREALAGDGSCPPGQNLSTDQFVKNFYQGALARQPNSAELQSWASQLRQAYYQGQAQQLATAQYMGRQIFRSTEYANRNRDDHSYVYDLYRAYLQREPDPPGWDFWTANVAQNGRDQTRLGFELSTEFANKVASLCPGSGGSAAVPLDGLANISYDSATNRITTSGFSYDAAGNQTRIVRADGSGQKYQYDAANRLVKVTDDYAYTVATYTYGDSNERLMAAEGDLRTYYDSEGGSVIGEYVESGNSTTPVWSKSYVYLGVRLLSTLTPNGGGVEAVQYHHPDRLGTRLVTDPSNGTSFEQVTMPFGTALHESPTGAGVTSGGTNRRFTSYDRSSMTGLDYAINRHYDPEQGRFTQVDPAGMNATSLESPQTLNLYSYVGSDPINRTDPDGMFWKALKRFVRALVLTVVAALVVAVAVLVVTTVAPFLASVILKPLVLSLLGIVAQHFVLTVYNGISDEVRAHGFTLGSLFRGLGRGLARFFKSLTNIKGAFGLGYYGNYCGKGNPNQSEGREPIDELDAACVEHDRVYQSTTDNHERARADRKLAKAALRAGLRLGRTGQLFALFVAVAFGPLAAIYRSLKSSGTSQAETTISVSGDGGERPHFVSPSPVQYRIELPTYPEIMNPAPQRTDRLRFGIT